MTPDLRQLISGLHELLAIREQLDAVIGYGPDHQVAWATYQTKKRELLAQAWLALKAEKPLPWAPGPLPGVDSKLDDFGPILPPPQLPVTILDMERTPSAFDMMLPMADPCPSCGATNMLVGDYACWGCCRVCAGTSARDDSHLL